MVRTTLSCGLPAYVFPKPGWSRKTAIVATQYGSIDLEFQDGDGRRATPPGIAHFLEHQLFKKQDTDVLMEFGRFGASANAFTDYTTTCYHFSTTDRFDEALDLLISFTFTPFFEDGKIENEKKIIEQELRMYDDSPDYRIYKNLMPALYRAHPVRLDIGGSVESIQLITRDLLESCYRTFYHPRNMALIAAGDIDPGAFFARADRALDGKSFAKGAKIQRFFPSEPSGVEKREVRAEGVVSRPRVTIGIKDVDASGDPLTRELETSVLLDLLFGRSGRFYTRTYESGLIDDTFSFSYNSESAFGFSVLGGETDDPERLVEEIRREAARARKSKLHRRDVDRSKRKRLGRFLRGIDSPEGMAFLFLGCQPKGIDPFDIPKAITRLTPRALEERLHRHFVEENLAVSILSPARN
jgi:predicted Zn-dependent peptidase